MGAFNIKGDDQPYKSAPYGGQPITEQPDPETWKTQDLSSKNLLPWQKNIPGLNLALAKDMQARGEKGDGIDHNGLLEYGLEADKGALGGAGDSLGSRSVESMSSALKNKYDNETSSKVDSLKHQIGVNDEPEKRRSNELARAAEIYGKDEAQKMKNFQEQKAFQDQRTADYVAYKNQRTQAESNVMSNVLGLATMGISKLL